jgi:hypothetical protein
VKLLQIEEPGGGLADAGLPGAAIGIDLSGAEAVVGFAVGGNAAALRDRDEFFEFLPVPGPAGTAADWQALFEGVRRRAERLLARPVTHAVVVLAALPSVDAAGTLRAAAGAAGIETLRLVDAAELPAADPPALAAALIAEDLMPRPGTGSPAPAYFR